MPTKKMQRAPAALSEFEPMFREMFPAELLRDQYELGRRVDHMRTECAQRGQTHIVAALEKWLSAQVASVQAAEGPTRLYSDTVVPDVIYDSYTPAKTAAAKQFKLRRYPEALALYRSALKFAQEDSQTVILQSNMAMCHLKMQRWDAVIESATAALELDETHAKSLYRRALAHQQLDQSDKAIEDLELALQLAPGDKSIETQLAKLRAGPKKSAPCKLSFSESIQLGGPHADYTGSFMKKSREDRQRRQK